MKKTTLYRIGSIANTCAKCYTIRPVKWTNDTVNTLGIDLYTSYNDLCKNYNSSLVKLRTICQLWYYRNLTWFGKVTIINTLMYSLLVYKMQVIANTPPNFYSEFENTIHNFFWKGKRGKISLQTLTLEKNEGGCSLSNIRTKHLSLLAKWVKIIIENPYIKNLAEQSLSTAIHNNAVWEGNLKFRDFRLITKCPRKNNFWSDVASAWCTYNFRKPDSGCEVWNQKLLYNTHVCIRNTPITYYKGISLIDDVCNRDGSFKTLQELIAIAPNFNWLDLRSIQKAIPENWLHLLSVDDKDHPFISNYSKVIRNRKSGASTIYKSINSERSVISDITMYWNKFFEVTKTEIQNAFVNIYCYTNVTKLRNFQFRMLHNKIFCNNILVHWNLVSSNICNFCNSSKQTVHHLFFECELVKAIWLAFEDLCESFGIPCCLTYKNVILNKVHDNPKQVVNFLLLLTKQYIHKCKCLNVTPRFDQLRNEIDLMYKIELFNAQINNQFVKHLLKWSPVRPLCSDILDNIV